MLAKMDLFDKKDKSSLDRMTRALHATQVLTISEKHNVQTEINVAEWNSTKKLRVYSFIVVFFCMMAQTAC